MPVYKLEALLKNITDKEIWEKGKYISENGNLIENEEDLKNEEDEMYYILKGSILNEERIYSTSVSWILEENKKAELISWKCTCQHLEEVSAPCEHLAALVQSISKAERERNAIRDENFSVAFIDDNIFQDKKKSLSLKFNVKTASEYDGEKEKLAFSDFEIYNKVSMERRKINFDTVVSSEIDEIRKNYIEDDLDFDDTSSDFLKFIKFIENSAKAMSIDFYNNEFIIPEFFIEKGVKYAEALGKNYNSNIEINFEIKVKENLDYYILEFNNFSQADILNEEYLLLREKGKVSIKNIKKEEIKKIKAVKEAEKREGTYKIRKGSPLIREILNNIRSIGEIKFDKSIKTEIFSPSLVSLRLFINETSNKDITIIPQYIYDGKTAEEIKDHLMLKNTKKEKEIFSKFESFIKKCGFKKVNGKFILPDKDDLIYNFMEDGFKNLKEKYKVIICEELKEREYKKVVPYDIGLGEVRQTAAILRARLAPLKRVIIAVPPYKLLYWKNRLTEESLGKKVKIISGDTEEKIKAFEKVKTDDIIVISYEDLFTECARFEYIDFEMIIFDNPLYVPKIIRDEFSEAIGTLKYESSLCFVGRFEEKAYSEWFYIFSLINPKYLGTKEEFYEKYISDSNKRENRDFLLSKLVNPFILRKTKEEVIDELPNKEIRDFYFEMKDGSKQKNIYMKYLNRLNKRLVILERPEQHRKKIFTVIERLRQVCSSPALINKKYGDNQGKINALSNILKTCAAEKRKVVIYSAFKNTAGKLCKHYKRFYKNCSFMSLPVSEKIKEEMYSKFYKEEYEKEYFFLFINNIGYEELQDIEYDVIIYFDPPWDRFFYVDKTKKLYRKKPVEINFITNRSIEDKINNKRMRLYRNKILKTYFEDMKKGKILKREYTREEIFAFLQI
ncbi:SNF2 helicase associated domain-containing protein [Fusobacterium perfoetens]|uniref:DEAD/DEAH box helicase n=1 Tax=Fusobacterium perfoetens TaxID=852 RepID=UPI001F4076A2|nr:DEAD/DEAH box helicase [Fusobacterium perfoetens]MCF2625198.1 SNF2 helicase associated domain-containing protein [Fusobacterium perfoetens]